MEQQKLNFEQEKKEWQQILSEKNKKINKYRSTIKNMNNKQKKRKRE
jgi:hypothetical protein